MNNEKSKELICNIHDDIWKKANRVINNVPRFFPYSNLNKEELYDMCAEMESHIDDLRYALEDIMQLAKMAKDMGQSMEDRLKDYRDAIEGLGFERSR